MKAGGPRPPVAKKPARGTRVVAAEDGKVAGAGAGADVDRELEELAKKSKTLSAALRKTGDSMRGGDTQECAAKDTADKAPQSRFELARQQVATWKADVILLRQQVTAQLAYCRSLREAGSSLQQEQCGQEEEDDKRRLSDLANHVRRDIRVVHAFLSEANAARKKAADLAAAREKHARQQKQLQLELSLKMPHVEEQEEEDRGLESLVIRGVENESDALGIETALSQLVTTSENGRKEVTVDQLKATLEEQQRVFSRVLTTLLADKVALDRKIGLKVALDSERQQSLNSECSEFARLVIFSSRAMEDVMNLAHTLAMQQEGGGVDLAAEVVQLRRALIESRAKAAQKGGDIPSTGSTCHESGGVRDARMSQIFHIEEARQRVAAVERDYVALQQRNAKLVQENGQLRDDLAQLRESLRIDSERHRRFAKSVAPRLATLERMVVTTATTFDAIMLDVDLLSGMYVECAAELSDREHKLEKVGYEQNEMSGNFRRLLKVVHTEKSDNARKDKIIAALMGMRHESAQIVKDMQSRSVRAEDKVSQLGKELESTKLELAQASDENKRLKTVRELSEVQLMEFRVQLDKAKHDKIHTSAKHAEEVRLLHDQVNWLKTSGMDRASREAYDEMALRLKHAISAYQKLEEKLHGKER